MMLKEQIMSLPIRGARIEIVGNCTVVKALRSLPTQGVRIEIDVNQIFGAIENIAPQAGSEN